jgi:ribosomal protein S18 acetylase RimI-like enzyme
MIRELRKEDVPVIADIGDKAWRGIYRMYRETLGEELFNIRCPDCETTKGEQIKAFCAAHPEWVLICEENGAIAGFITFQLDPGLKIGVIGNNAVDPDCGLKGLGQQMYKAALDFFRKNGMTHAQVTTGLDHAHAPARKAYERAGFNIRKEDITYFMKL